MSYSRAGQKTLIEPQAGESDSLQTLVLTNRGIAFSQQHVSSVLRHRRICHLARRDNWPLFAFSINSTTSKNRSFPSEERICLACSLEMKKGISARTNREPNWDCYPVHHLQDVRDLERAGGICLRFSCARCPTRLRYVFIHPCAASRAVRAVDAAPARRAVLLAQIAGALAPGRPRLPWSAFIGHLAAS